MFMPLKSIPEPNPLGSSSTIPVPMMTSTESLRANGLERNTSFWYLLKHNWRQLTSLTPGLMLLSATGNLHLSFSIWKLMLYVFDDQNTETDTLIAWFVGAAGGGLLGALLNANWSKILIYYSIAVASIPVSVAFVVHQMSSTYNLLLIGRALAGLLYGIMLVTLVLHIADNSSQFMRRHFMTTIALTNLLPTVLLAEFISTVTGFCDVTASIGVCMFVLAILTLIFMPSTYESIVFLLENGWDLRALEIMLKLRNESRHFIRRDFNEFKMMLVEDYGGDNADGHSRRAECCCRNIFADGNSRPLVLILLLRLLNVFLTSNCVYYLFLTNVWFDYKHWMGGYKSSLSNDDDHDDAGIFGNDNATTIGFSDIEIASENNTVTTEMTTFASEIFNETMTTELNETFIDGGVLAQSTVFQAFYDAIQNAAFSIDLNGNDNTTIADEFDGPELSVPKKLQFFTYVSGNITWSSDLFIRSAYSYRLSTLQISQFLIAICLIKIILGIPFLCIVEKFQIYRNRAVYKIALCIAIINLMFFMATVVCNLYDDSMIFTFYIAKLLSLIYGLYLLIAFSIDSIGYSELGESFPLTKRYGCIALIIAAEYTFHAIGIALIMNAMFRFYFHVMQSAIICCICYALLRRMPNECLHCTLRSARDKHFLKMANN